MIPYSRDPHETIPSSAVKIIGLGGAGANMLERIALDGMEGAELLALNTDIRTLGSCIAREKVQLGVNLTKGLGTGGDPELGHQAVLEAEEEIRESVKGRRIVFLCAGLGGGTGSGAAPIVTRIAREEGAFVVVFATMPFAFEGKRRRNQAETALNELAVLSNALVTFDNNRMGELVLAKQGVHEAFIAADHMICESIKAVIRLVIRPGLINVGLDDLMSALRTNRSRCLFGSGLAKGKDRSSKALQNALSSPLLDQGSLLKEAQTVLVHLCGGEDLTLFEIELLMQKLQKYVPETAHVLFGAAIDPAMGESLSLTLISALPEDTLAMAPRDSLSQSEGVGHDVSREFAPPVKPKKALEAEPEVEVAPKSEIEDGRASKSVKASTEPEKSKKRDSGAASGLDVSAAFTKPEPSDCTGGRSVQFSSPLSKLRRSLSAKSAETATAESTPNLFDEGAERPFAESETSTAEETEEKPAEPEVEAFKLPEDEPDEKPEAVEDDVVETVDEEDPKTENEPAVAEFVAMPSEEDEADEPDVVAEEDTDSKKAELEEEEDFATANAQDFEVADLDIPDLESSGFGGIPKRRPEGAAPWKISDSPKESEREARRAEASDSEVEVPKLKLGVKAGGEDSELTLDSAPRGRFEGEDPNVVDGEDLDLPPFLRKKRK